ncbi:alpha/beta hydrolase [Paucibacter sp. Y2R2-4]|uniref:alpha/beta hydrolase n=1 Tax=Paucibacter sp. Y2R2-4 TaxID=2893553 RepID=UPI0021E46A86|nr:lysophospholipase [Paucibacter sp. Y2R2-4]MCV2351652.1 alpha/beta hydrolase [Paucibacter sp. Y2R2-4]
MARILAHRHDGLLGAWPKCCALALAVSASALSGCAWLSDKERALVLRPSPGRPAAFEAEDAGLRPGDQRYVLNVPAMQTTANDTSAEDRLAVWWLPHPNPQAPTLLYLHGTLRNLYENLPKIEAVRDAGYAVLAVDYRGWGDSSPIIPSEASIDADAARAWAELVKRQPDPSQRVIFGHSMGGAVAVSLASQLRRGVDYGGLVLEATFTRMPDVAASAGTLGRIGAAITSLKFESINKISRVDAPTLILHGDADKLVPVDLGRRLRDAAQPGVCWVEIAGGSHSGLHREAAERYKQSLQGLVSVLPPRFSGPEARPWPAGVCSAISTAPQANAVKS